MTVKNRPTNDAIKGLLLEGNFGSSNDDLLPLSDPISTVQLILKLDDIKPYDKNPRRERNPAYDEIKASILSKKKLNNNFNVTRRPGDDKYMVESGGNTRLQILHELYMETADEVFNSIHCLFVPWVSESFILTAHLIENEMRGEMMLIDKAFGMNELKREIETEKGYVISDREFIKQAETKGYKISRTQLRRFNYALKLDKMIPGTLRSGIGGRRLDVIKKTEEAYLQLCEDKREQFDAVFMDVMSENDAGEHFDFDQVRNDLDFQLEPVIGIRHNIIYMKVNHVMENNSSHRENFFDSDFNEVVEPSIERELETLPSPAAEMIKDKEQKAPTPMETGTLNGAVEEEVKKEGLIQSALNGTQETTDDKKKSLVQVQKTPVEVLKTLRERNYALAIKIAGGILEDSVIAMNSGLGFVMEIPSFSLIDAKKELAENIDYYRWWILFSLSEQAMEDGHFAIWSFLDIYKRLGKQRDKVEAENDQLVMIIGSEISVHSIIHYAMHNTEVFDDKVFTDIFRLMENTRKIRKSFTEKELWQVAK